MNEETVFRGSKFPIILLKKVRLRRLDLIDIS